MPSSFFSFGLEFVFAYVCTNAKAFNSDKQIHVLVFPAALDFWFVVLLTVYAGEKMEVYKLQFTAALKPYMLSNEMC